MHGSTWPARCTTVTLMRTLRIKNRLLQRRRDLLGRYHDELARATEELDSREIEGVENAVELWDARVLTILSNADADALGSIVAALRRLELGTYGVCVACGVGIEHPRLSVLPEASTCFDCAVDTERPTLARVAH